MSAGIILVGLLMIFLPVFNMQVRYAEEIHYRYMLERSLKSATLAAYEKDSINASFTEFKNIFVKTCPKGFEVKIELKNFENYPKFVHYKIEASNDKGYSYHLEESIIEEDK
ncbi:MAG TPA: hypothetical protein VFC75_00145 [Erysipelothrix sp.]|nr:hypothetical protein [Erysipelothrix sp.]